MSSFFEYFFVSGAYKYCLHSIPCTDNTFGDAVHAAALEDRVPSARHYQDWYNENNSENNVLLEEKRNQIRAYSNDRLCVTIEAAFTNLRNIVQSRHRSIQDSWLTAKAN